MCWPPCWAPLTSTIAFNRILADTSVRGWPKHMLNRVQTCALTLSLLVAPAAWPQGGNSTVRGSVRDQAQAVIPAATVTLTNVNTNLARTSKTNDAGIYSFPG